MKGMMKAFYQTNRAKPEHILFYRDGVSEGQFQTVSVVFCDDHIRYTCIYMYNWASGSEPT